MNGIVHFCKHLILLRVGPKILTLFCKLVATCHLVNGDCEMFGSSEMEPQRIEWTTPTHHPIRQFVNELKNMASQSKMR